ncbi:MAG: hypothetical protein JXQ65_09535 [Candidatus Marinimicrobia bacterium]|nr:hypothetical protein [Candidatus Neomarinimicrobiota bacterium]
MNKQDVFKKLNSECPSGYKINEIIKFAYPFRRIRVEVTVNKNPENSMLQIYTVFIRSIISGYNTNIKICKFLGLQDDDFILKELYHLREEGCLELISGEWMVTEHGKEFLENNKVLQVLENEQYEFLIDGLTNTILSKTEKLYHNDSTDKKIETLIKTPIKDPSILENRSEEIRDLYNIDNQGKSYIVSIDKSEIKFDKNEYNDFYLIEYIPQSTMILGDPYIEVRWDNKDLMLDKRLTDSLSPEYPELVYGFSESDRFEINKMEENGQLVNENDINMEIDSDNQKGIETLTVWQTQAKFEEALKSVKEKILIESPWIKKATLKYIPLMEKALEHDVEIYLIYGIKKYAISDNDFNTLNEIKKLDKEYENFHLIHLPTHFLNSQINNLSGTHRKLIIKDADYYLQGSYNFLSFNKQEGEKVSNEETILIPNGVKEKWKQVFKEYGLNKL